MVPTSIQKSSKNFKIELPGNRTKLLISPESAWSTDLRYYIFFGISIGRSTDEYGITIDTESSELFNSAQLLNQTVLSILY